MMAFRRRLPFASWARLAERKRGKQHRPYVHGLFFVRNLFFSRW